MNSEAGPLKVTMARDFVIFKWIWVTTWCVFLLSFWLRCFTPIPVICGDSLHLWLVECLAIHDWSDSLHFYDWVVGLQHSTIGGVHDWGDSLALWLVITPCSLICGVTWMNRAMTGGNSRHSMIGCAAVCYILFCCVQSVQMSCLPHPVQFYVACMLFYVACRAF